MTPSSPPARPRFSLQQYAPVLLAAGLVGGLALFSGTFLSADNLLNVGLQAAVIGILALGETSVIISGGIDLSVGSVLAISGVAAGMVLGQGGSPWLAGAAGLLMGTAWGVVNGFMVAQWRLPSFIATLGAMGMARGVALIMTNAIPLSDGMLNFTYLGSARWGRVPFAVILVAIVAILVHIMLTRTRFGRRVFAVGGNAESARLSGVPVGRVHMGVYALSGLLAGLAGILQASRTVTAQPTAGEGYELDAIAATVIGGASLLGGKGSIGGTVVGFLIMALLRSGLNQLSARYSNVSTFWQQVIIGAIIVAAVFWDQHTRRRQS